MLVHRTVLCNDMRAGIPADFATFPYFIACAPTLISCIVDSHSYNFLFILLRIFYASQLVSCTTFYCMQEILQNI